MEIRVTQPALRDAIQCRCRNDAAERARRAEAASSVMMSSTLGAPFGGTTRGAHQAFDSEAFSLITPPNFGSGGGSCFPLMVVVALGEPSSPVTCCATAAAFASMNATMNTKAIKRNDFVLMSFFPPVELLGI